MTQQVTKEEFEEVLNECEDKYAIMSCIEENHTINVAEVAMYNRYRELGLRIKNNAINLFLPKIDINTDTKKFIGEELEIDDHMRRIFVLEFFKRIIREYIEKKKGKSSEKNSGRVKFFL